MFIHQILFPLKICKNKQKATKGAKNFIVYNENIIIFIYSIKQNTNPFYTNKVKILRILWLLLHRRVGVESALPYVFRKIIDLRLKYSQSLLDNM